MKNKLGKILMFQILRFNRAAELEGTCGEPGAENDHNSSLAKIA